MFDISRVDCTLGYKENEYLYRTYLAIRQGFPLSRMSTNNQISLMQFCCNTSFTLPKQSQRSRSVLKDGSRFLGLFWKKKTLSYKGRYMVILKGPNCCLPFLVIRNCLSLGKYCFILLSSPTDHCHVGQ